MQPAEEWCSVLGMETTAGQAGRKERRPATPNLVYAPGFAPIVQKFLEERTYSDPGSSIMASDLRDAFDDWYDGIKIPSPTQFGIIMKQYVGVRTGRTKTGIYYIGIALKND